MLPELCIWQQPGKILATEIWQLTAPQKQKINNSNNNNNSNNIDEHNSEALKAE